MIYKNCHFKYNVKIEFTIQFSRQSGVFTKSLIVSHIVRPDIWDRWERVATTLGPRAELPDSAVHE